MAQPIQIVPKYSFPYVETVVNDYTTYNDTPVADVATDSVVRYIFPFVSSKGVDNKFIRKRTRASIVSAYGDTNYKKYGQPLMQALSVAEASNTEVWCMRVMPDDATYAHNIVSAFYKADKPSAELPASECKFRIKYVQRSVNRVVADDGTVTNPGIVTLKDLYAEAAKLDNGLASGVYTDNDGYTQIPGVFTLYSAGRGKYGNNYHVRMTQDLYYEKDYGIKYYDFEVISTESGLNKEATYVGSTVTSTKYDTATLITDILADADDGVVPVFVHVDEDGFEDLYNAYVTWLNDLGIALNTELAKAEADLKAATEDADKATYKALVENLKVLIASVSTVPEMDTFDAIFGRPVASATTNSFVEFVKDGENVVTWDSPMGAKLSGGSDGLFETAADETALNAAIDACYVNAFDGVYDKRVLTSKRIKASALWDANYSMAVKKELAELALLRNDAICYLDCGVMDEFTDATIRNLITDYSIFDDYKISKNVHHYYIKETTTKKRVPVTVTYFLARQYADHVLNYGSYIPFVKSYAQLTGHIKDSLAPSIEDYETDIKELLTDNRFNFFETVDDNVYQRATQSTSQMSSSDLLEENNVATLYEIKRIVEMDISDRLYDFSDAEARQRFRNYEKAKFADWSGREVESFDIDFRMNAWEAERSILHAYIDVTFRGLQKRAILEIDVNRRAAAEASEEV